MGNMKNLIGLFIVLALSVSSAVSQDTPAVPSSLKNAVPLLDQAGSEKVSVNKQETDSAATPTQTYSTYTRPNAEKRFKRYMNSTFGPFAFTGVAVGAGFATATNSPEEWGGQWKGFGRRFASSLGRNTIKNSVIYGLDEAMKLDGHYYRSEKRDVGSRLKNAVVSTFTARKPNGKRVLGVPRLAGVYASNMIAETWYPGEYNWKRGVRGGTANLGFNVVLNLFREFVWKK